MEKFVYAIGTQSSKGGVVIAMDECAIAMMSAQLLWMNVQWRSAQLQG
jgi:hypothetical protein